MRTFSFSSRAWRRLLTCLLCPFLLFTPALPYTHVAAADGAASVVFTSPITASGGVSMVENGKGDSSFSLFETQGKPVMQVNQYAYFLVTDPVLLATNTITVTITYFDTGDNFVFQYCGVNDAYTAKVIYGGTAGTFKTVSLTLTDTSFNTKRQNFEADFRFCGGAVIHEVTLTEGVPGTTEVIFTDPVTALGGIEAVASGLHNGDCVYTLTTVQGKPAAEIEKYVYFRVTNATLNKAEKLTLSLTYLDEGNSSMLLQYCSTGSNYELLHVQRFNTGEFVTVEIPLTNAAFGNAGQNYGAAFRFSGGTIHSLTVTEGCTDPLDQVPPTFAPQTEQNNVIGKGVAGYQVWFRANEDANGNWHHWGQNGKLPAAGNIHPEMYPYTDDYVENGATLYQTGFSNLGNDNPAVLFNSPDREIIKTHMQWAQEYDIDGLAVQRFYSATYPMRSDGKNTLQIIQEEAEAHDRLFYVMYDFSYAARNDPATFIRTVQLDFIYNVEEKGVASSPNYGHADGKPVVCLWGLHGDPAAEYFCGTTATTLIDWFHDRGYYVIGGSPDNNYDKATGEYMEPFTKLDMLSLWTPGRYNMDNAESWLKHHVEIDLAFCEQYGIDYQPVLFSGFGWTNMGNNGYVNHFPRYAGDFLWKQAYILKRDYDIESVYFAMWDEYDEGTAIMKAASDYFEIPTDQYFLTYAADGWWLSNDYYLRAAGAIIDMVKEKTPVRENIDIPHSEGPVYWRNSFESRETTYTLDGGTTRIPAVGQLDVCLNNPAWLNKTAFSSQTAAIVQSLAKSGNYAFRFYGTASSGAEAAYKLADTRITASAPLTLTYSLYAANDNGRDVFVDLVFADGTRLSDYNLATVNTRGSVGEWTTVTVTLGSTADTKSVVGVAVGYRGNSGTVDAYVDDIVLQHSEDAHVWGDGKVQGNTITYTCQNTACGATVTERYVHDPAHTTEYRDRIEPAVGKVGYTAGTWCTVCEQYIEGGEEIPALILWGDVNGNGIVNSTDARLTLQYAVGKAIPTPLDLTAADVDQNGKVDSTDARLILQYTVRKITNLPVG